jgi:hypothetical protein
MNYYYEVPEGSNILGRLGGGYYYQANCSPAQGGWLNHIVHSQALNQSTRVWLENANGVTLVKAPSNDTSWGRVDEQEFVMVKLRARNLIG